MNEQQNQFFGNEQQFGGQNTPQFTQQEGQFAQPEQQVQQQQSQFEQPNPQMQQGLNSNGFEMPKRSNPNKKKALTITALVTLILLLIGGTTIGVWALMSGNGNSGNNNNANTVVAGQSSKDVKASSVGNIFQYVNKVSQAKKIDGKFDVNGEVSLNSSGGGRVTSGPQKVKLGVESGAVHVERTEGDEKPENFFTLTGTVRASADSSDTQTKSIVKTIDGEKFTVSLSGDMVFKWSMLGRSDSNALSGETKKQVKALFALNKDNQEAARELRDFLLKGYNFKISKDGDSTTMTINKDDLKALAEKMEENVKNDESKFKELYLKSSKDASESTYNSMIEHILNREISKGIERGALNSINEFEYKVSYKDSGDRIQEKAELKLDIKDSSFNAKFNLKTEMTYTF